MPAPKRSKIEFTDYSAGDLNFVLGCTSISTGCEHCYARRVYEMFGKDFSKVTVYPDKLKRLLKWQPKPPYKRGSRPLAFVVDMGDLFHEDVPTSIIRQFLQVVSKRQDIDWLVLTKRPGRMRVALTGLYSLASFVWPGSTPFAPLPNLWFGVTVENEDNLWRIEELLKTPAAVRWVSYEPALGPVDFSPYLGPVHVDSLGVPPRDNWDYWRNGLDWLVIGGESGPNRRPFKKEWAWDVLEVGRREGVPVFLKQDSGPHPGVPLLDREGNQVKEWPKM